MQSESDYSFLSLSLSLSLSCSLYLSLSCHIHHSHKSWLGRFYRSNWAMLSAERWSNYTNAHSIPSWITDFLVSKIFYSRIPISPWGFPFPTAGTFSIPCLKFQSLKALREMVKPIFLSSNCFPLGGGQYDSFTHV